jgi:dihydrofolate synthase/folylpolyglutamate synthase
MTTLSRQHSVLSPTADVSQTVPSAASDLTTLPQWLAFIEQSHPIDKIELGLARVQRVAERAALHQLPGKVILVAGTNGKGTTIRSIEQMLLAQGYSVGVYSSPHLLHFNERLRINNVDVADALWCEAFAAIEQLRTDVALTYFEFTTLAAFYILRHQQPDVCLIEVGLGGRLDATNIITPHVTVLTTIDLDHQAFLGPDRAAIGREKAGIFRPQVPAVITETDIPETVWAVLAQSGSPYYRLNHDYHHGIDPTSGRWYWSNASARLNDLPVAGLPLMNVASALQVLSILDCLPPAATIAKVLSGLTLPGRMQWLSTAPAVLLDVAHNPQSAAYLAHALAAVKPRYQRIFAIVGMLADKDISASLAPFADVLTDRYAVTLPGPRGAAASQVVAAFGAQACRIADGGADLNQTWHEVQAQLTAQDLCVVFGSFVTVSQFLAQWSLE